MKFLAICVMACLATVSHAQNQSTLPVPEARTSLMKGFAPFVTIGGGYTGYDNTLDVEGASATAKILGSYGLSNYVFDLGAGIQGQKFSQTAAPVSNVSHPTLEAAARYQFTNLWQAGLVWNTHFNKGENYGANQADAQFAGLQVLKVVSISKSILARLGGRLMTDVNVNPTAVNMLMLDAHFTWDLGKGEGMEAKSLPVAQAATPVTAKPETNLRAMALADLRKDGVSYFELGSARLNAQAKTKLNTMAKQLAASNDKFDKIVISGHTDASGTEKINLALSRERAQAVAKVMMAAGVPAAKIDTVGKSAMEPAVNGAKEIEPANRRTGIEINGVKEGALPTILN